MPAGAPLFGNIQSRSQSKNLVECKAGKMTLKGKMVHPDKRKGLLYVYQSDDSLMHFCWKDRQSGTVEDDLIIFPDDCEFKRVTQCTTGRVYVLKFKSSNRKFFFWIQEPKTDKDEENCRRINEVLNNPPTPGSQRSGGGTPDGDLQSLLNNMSQQQLMQLFGGVGQIGGLSSLLGTMGRRGPSSGTQGSSRSGTTTSTTSSASATTGSTTTTSSSAPAVTTTTAAQPAVSTAGKETSEKPATAVNPPAIQLSDLQNFLSGLNVPTPETTTQRTVDLASTITSENLQTLLRNTELVTELLQHVPSVEESSSTVPPSEQLRSTLASPQFQQALSMFSAALQSGQLGPVVQQFEVGPEAVDAANQGNMEEFVKALQKASISKDESSAQGTSRAPKEEEKKQPGGDEKRKKTDGGSGGSDKKDDDDEEWMTTD
ncbi:proteasomal ubiquitin receptor ADRM1-B isoform X1 [Schistocerca americana]|uniref:proteasomal ubiquitin receptor ADRM1-B isoform X1 n=1 Tax=Schistocerca americana TaxID=7009 RepID=UPI001F4F3B66|nr:proteasomal ubiquitin receptor ADRM1-B isoform X1 [Schistocerca americana]XP_047098963.1 proteasomal ubiquitin receptor ADRM1-B isoform X1 [Schistocerca piceifrons]XP_049786615.1 proteasomal ubiquitin receptor ADRM1-B isoform X1 [Schistocerca cancellata]